LGIAVGLKDVRMVEVLLAARADPVVRNARGESVFALVENAKGEGGRINRIARLLNRPRGLDLETLKGKYAKELLEEDAEDEEEDVIVVEPVEEKKEPVEERKAPVKKRDRLQEMLDALNSLATRVRRLEKKIGAASVAADPEEQ
jgi:hypothetical protein